jgi:hypothetical protein
MIAFACPSCRMKLRVAENRVHRRVKCPFCQKSAAVPDRTLPLALSPPIWYRWQFLVAAGLVATLLGLLLWVWR